MKHIKFVRFGGLSPVHQEHYTINEKGFHNPPVKKGLYAFPWPYIDLFLISSTDEPGHVSNKAMWLKDDNGNLIDFNSIVKEVHINSYDYTPDFMKLLKKRKIKKSQIGCAEITDKKTNKINYYVRILKKPRTFNHKGKLWHHLGEYVKPGLILQKSGSWVKTEYNVYLEAFEKIRHHELSHLHKIKNEWTTKKELHMAGIGDPFKNPGMTVCKDCLEVFIENIK